MRSSCRKAFRAEKTGYSWSETAFPLPPLPSMHHDPFLPPSASPPSPPPSGPRRPSDPFLEGLCCSLM